GSRERERESERCGAAARNFAGYAAVSDGEVRPRGIALARGPICFARFQLGTRMGAPSLSRHTRVRTVPSWLPPLFAARFTGHSLEGPATALKSRGVHASACRAAATPTADCR